MQKHFVLRTIDRYALAKMLYALGLEHPLFEQHKILSFFRFAFSYSVFNAHLINVKVCIVDLDNECLIYAVSRKSEAFFVSYSLLL